MFGLYQYNGDKHFQEFFSVYTAARQTQRIIHFIKFKVQLRRKNTLNLIFDQPLITVINKITE